MEPVRRITTETVAWGRRAAGDGSLVHRRAEHCRRAGVPVYGVSAVFIDVDDSRAHGRD